MYRNTEKTIKNQNPKKLKQLLNTLQNSQHLSSLGRYLISLLCGRSKHYNMRENVEKKTQI